ncbi:MAG: hypothetical protein ABW194_02690 [Novosphingobium sp.]
MTRAVSVHRPAAGHPLRRRLRLAALRRRIRVPNRRFTAQDLREFLVAYCACFLAAYAFIA